MKYYLIDASAFIHWTENEGKTKIDFLHEKAVGQAFLYIPQFCIAEVLNTYARFFFKDKKIGPDTYTKWRNAFLRTVRNRRILYAYDLHRYHNLNADKIYRTEHKTPLKRTESPLSAFDILIIAMAMELKRIHSGSEVIILSRDARLLRIVKLVSIEALWFE